LELGGYGGNFYAAGNSFQISKTKTVVERRQAMETLGDYATAIQALNTGATANFASDKTLLNHLDKLRSDLSAYEGRGIDIFADAYREKAFLDVQRRLVLWADVYRRQVDYGTVRRSNASVFYQTYAADTLTYALRPVEQAPLTFADWMPAAAKNLKGSADWEDVDVTIAQGSGSTAIGRGLIPGQAVQVQIADAAGANLGLRIGFIRQRGDPVAQENYTRPRQPDVHSVALPAGKTITYTTAWGGPIFLNYSNATAGSVVKLRIKNGLKYAHFDFTRNPSQAEIDEAITALKRADFGWQTSKMVGGEVQQTIGFAQSAIGNLDPKVYVEEHLKGMIFDSNHIANGYNNMPMTSHMATVCADIGWDCSSNTHRAPSVQHFVGWLAQCGFLCSGNPSDGSAGISPGWGWWHELGHNTVKRHMTIVFGNNGCPVECDNNILAGASALRQYDISGGQMNVTDHALNHKYLYQKIASFRDQGLTDEPLRQAIYNDFWVGKGQLHDAMRAIYFQLGFVYARERWGQNQPKPADVMDFLGLISKGQRLVDNTWTAQNKTSLGMSRFSNKSISNHELLYVTSSVAIGKDMRKYFQMYGLPIGQNALDSIADLNLPVLDFSFYAVVPSQPNKLELGQWVDAEQSMPAYPL
jgi:hypothetical protein